MAYTPANYLVCQNFEGTGFDNSEYWIKGFEDTPSTGVVDEDYTSAPLIGSQSLRMKDDADYGGYTVHKWRGDDGGIDEAWFCFMVKFLDSPSNETLVEIMQTYWVEGTLDSPTTVELHEIIGVDSSGHLGVFNEQEGEVGEGAALSLNTLYYVWYHINRADLSNATWELYVSETTTKPGSPYASGTSQINSVASTTYINALGFTTFHAEGYEYLIDRAIVDDAEIGDVDEEAAAGGAYYQHYYLSVVT